MASVKIVLRKKKNKDGTYPLAVRITKDRKSSYVWISACSHTDADHVIFDQLAFGTSTEELLLMAIAIKYAKLQGKAVMISAGQQ